MDNLDLWDKVGKTNPNNTKKVTQRGGFTAIDAYSQIKAATEQFGPVGKGWGWEVLNIQYPPNDTVTVHIKMWHGSRDNFFDVFGQKDLNTKGANSKADEDCFKKALTDAVTKGLSYLGFNADVFMGMFDDNKYVEAQTKANAPKAKWHGPIQKSKIQDAIVQFNKELDECESMEQFEICMSNNKELLDQIKLDVPNDVKLKNPDCTSGETTGAHVTRLKQTFKQQEEMNNAESM